MNTQNPFDRLEQLVEQRKVLQARTDQLFMMNQAYLIDNDTTLTITIEAQNAIFKGRHNPIIRSVLKHLHSEYEKRLKRKEEKIKQVTHLLNEQTP
ncbi:MAG: hypothetical protein F9K23_09785 [Bacteroidetes bacterium]|nr:MAG: hypothetical protein F9K23_09785 [Bacteroidota bacterium]